MLNFGVSTTAKSKFGKIFLGAIAVGLVAAVGLTFFGVGSAIIPALIAGNASSITTGAVLGKISAAFASFGPLVLGGAALVGSGLGAVSQTVYEKNGMRAYGEDGLRIMEAVEEGIKRADNRSQQPDFEAMGKASGINYNTNWVAQTGRGQAAGQSAGVAQPTPRI